MTRMKPSPMFLSTVASLKSFELCWPAVACGCDARLSTENTRPAELSLHVSLIPVTATTVALHASVRHADTTTTLLDLPSADCTVETDGSLWHAAITDRNQATLLTLTLRRAADHSEYTVLYARTPLLALAGFTGGRCDPPTVRITSS